MRYPLRTQQAATTTKRQQAAAVHGSVLRGPCMKSGGSFGRRDAPRRRRPVVDDTLFLELCADALLLPQLLDAVKLDAIRVDLHLGEEAALEHRAQARL